MRDQPFLEHVTERLAALPGVVAVALGGSRAQGTNQPDSDWDFAIYYRDGFSPEDLRAVGWAGEVSEIGGWGGGVFNGGAWLEIEERRVDVHYRELDDVLHHLSEAEAGRFHIEPLMFHLAGIPSYLVVAELAVNRVLCGELPRPEYPAALRRAAERRWWDIATLTLGYARANHAPRGQHALVAGSIAVAACQTAHAILARRGEWVTNEKTLLDRAGLRAVDDLLAKLGTDPAALASGVEEAETLLRTAVRSGKNTASTEPTPGGVW